ncbi:hypothetical protein MRX96_043200 [Rhipicephalus microplus]
MWSLHGLSGVLPGVLGPSFEAIKPGKRHLRRAPCSNWFRGTTKGCIVYVRVFVSASGAPASLRIRVLEGDGERAGGFFLGPRSSIIAEVITRHSSLSRCRSTRVFFLSSRRTKVRKLARMRHGSLAPPHLLRHVPKRRTHV